jgi:hypothetical protein
MHRAPLLIAVLALLLVPAGVAAAAPPQPLTFTRIAGTTPPNPVDSEAPQAEIAAYHAASDRIFATNTQDDTLDVYQGVLAPALIDRVPLGGGPNSVAVRRDGLVAVAVEADPKTEPGHVQFVDATTLQKLGTAPAGALPDMLTFTPDGKRVLVANEGEPNDAYTIDPQGSVTIVDAASFAATQVRFSSNRSYPGVRIFGPGANAAQDFEPEYIAADPDGRLAYVSLQENNAIAILDLKQARFRSVRALGYKNWGASAMDASDTDGVGQEKIVPRPNVLGMFQPDALAAYRDGGKTYLVSANEGDARDYDGFGEEARAGTLTLDPSAFPAPGPLSRLNVTDTMGDTDGDGDFDRLFAFGARSLSVLDHTGRVRFDTGDELERRTLALTPSLFNSNHGATPNPDNRSDDKGPEPEGATTGVVGGRRYAFLGLERHSGLVAYDLQATRGEAAFAGLAHNRPQDRGPEGIDFVPPADSPTGAPLVLVTNETTSTVGVWSVAPAP